MTIVLYDKLLQAVRAIVFLVWPRVYVRQPLIWDCGLVFSAAHYHLAQTINSSHPLTRRLLEFVFNGLVLVGLKL